MESKSNKILVLEFYKNVVGERNISLIDTYVSDQYIQHSPSLKTGKAGLLEALEFLKQIPKPKEQKSPITHAVEDGDFVMTRLDFEFMGIRKNVIDFFKLEHGKVIEHWDAIQDIPGGMTAHVSPYSSEAGSRDVQLTEYNKSLVGHFFYGESQRRNSILSKNYIEHNSEILQTTGRLDTYFDRTLRSTKIVHRVLGENNFVVVQSEGLKIDKRFVFYDLFDVLDGSIVEHWSVEQEIPAVMPHGNGMI